MTDFKIETGVPVSLLEGNTKYPFAKMNVGDSFAFDPKLRSKIATASSYYGKRNAKKFSTSTNRIWRVA